MPEGFELYDGHYDRLATDVQVAVRRETFDEDLGQASWITLAEAREWFRLLALDAGSEALEVACGSGGITCRMALETGARCVGVDVNARGIEAAAARARDLGLAARAEFRCVDAAKRLPFPDASFDAVFCNDSINHLPGRSDVLRDWHRVLRPGGRLLFTDPIVVTGPLSNAEIRARSSIGYFLFTPAGHNERLLAQSGFTVREVRDETEAVATVSRKWSDARSKRRDALAALEGDGEFEKFQEFLGAVHVLASERRLSRYAYFALKPAASGGTARGGMGVRESYDSAAGAYADHLVDELDAKPLDRHLLDRFAEATRGRGLVADLGCGPGHVARYLSERGVTTAGIDLSPKMIDEARRRHPGLDFRIGDMRALDLPDGGLVGAVAFYAIVHFDADALAEASREIRRVLAPGGLALIAFHAGEEVVHVDELFGAPVSLDFRFHLPSRVVETLRSADLVAIERTEREPYPGAEYPSRRCYVLAKAV